jgi:hypothetical protein
MAGSLGVAAGAKAGAHKDMMLGFVHYSTPFRI